MPIQEPTAYGLVPGLNREATVNERLKRQSPVLLSHEGVGYANAIGFVDPEDPLIERPVMQFAEGDSILDQIRTVMRPPMNMPSVNARCLTVKQPMKSAERTAIPEILQDVQS